MSKGRQMDTGEGDLIPVNGKGKKGNNYMGKMETIMVSLREMLLSDDSRLTKKAAREILDTVALLQGIVGEQSQQIARLEGALEERGKEVKTVGRIGLASTNHQASLIAFPKLRTSSSSRGGTINKGMATYAVVARSLVPEAEKGVTKEKVLKVGNEIKGVKVKGVRELKDGGVAIIAASARDVERIRGTPAFKEAGIKLCNPKMSEAKLILSDVPGDMTSDALISEVMLNNLQGRATSEELGAIRMVQRMESKTGKCSVVVEAPSKIRKILIAEGRVYMGFSSIRVREYEDVARCYGCGSFGHMLSRCPTGRLCRNCGEAGHSISVCANLAKCRNCAVRGLEASHRVTSTACPCYTNECEKRRGRIIG